MEHAAIENRAVRLHLLAAGLLLTALLCWDLGGRELWTDEEFSLAAQAPLHHAAFGDASHPPLYPALLHFWLQWGTSDGWLRAFSIPWALLAWWLGWLVAVRLGLKREGLLAAWLMALSPLVLTYFRMGRYFSFTAAVTMLAIYVLVRLWQRRGWAMALTLGIVAAATAYTDYVAFLVVMALVGLTVLAALVRRDGRLAGQCAVAAVVALCLIVPIISMTLQRAGMVGLINPDPLAGSLWGLAVKLALPVFALATGECVDPWRWWLTGPALLVTVGGLIVGLWRMIGRRGPCPPAAMADTPPCEATAEPGVPEWLIALAWPLNIAIGAAMMSTVAANVPPNRIVSFAMFTAPLAYLTLARGLCRRSAGILPAVVLVAVYGYGLHNYFAREQLLNPGFAPPWRQVNTILQQHEQPGDRVLAIEDAFWRYYDGHALTGREPQVHEMIAGSLTFDRRTWLITRDRGSQEMMGYGLELRGKLLAQGAAEQVWNIMPRSVQEQRMLSLVLRRPAWDAYVKLYLFTPRPAGPAGATDHPSP
ncbi:glycosyltransferase family 39 protein [bacterium]|nr:glycosyltransferase family 39 protein [bacterium]